MTETISNWTNIARRFHGVYVAAVCDVLDDMGLRHQYLDHRFRPLNPSQKIAGPAFTIIGGPSAETDTEKRIGPRVIDQFRPGVVAVYDTQNTEGTGVWGELWAAGAAQRGCVGAVVDGGVRDTGFMREAGFPIYYRFTSPGDALGRFTVIDYECPVSAGGVRVSPGDYVFGDEDGIVIIPSELTIEVIDKAEQVSRNENRIRAAIAGNQSLFELYKEFGKF